MIKPKMKEKEQDFISSCQHRQPICMVVFDPNLNNNQRLLCPLCLTNFESNKKMIGIGKVIQMIEENHNDKIFRVENNFELVKQLQESLRRLQTFTHEKLQMLIVSIEKWLKQICESYQSYSFFVELENLIQNECSDPNIYSDMKVTYESHFCKIAQNLQQFEQQCSEILQTISDSFQQQGIKNAIQSLPKAKRVKMNQIKEDHNNKEINESIEQLQEKYYYLQLYKNIVLYKTIINNYNIELVNNGDQLNVMDQDVKAIEMQLLECEKEGISLLDDNYCNYTQSKQNFIIEERYAYIELKKSLIQLLNNQKKVLAERIELKKHFQALQVLADNLFIQLNYNDAEIVQLIQKLSNLTIQKSKQIS